MIDYFQMVMSLFVFGAVFMLVWSMFGYGVVVQTPVQRRVAISLGLMQQQTWFDQPILKSPLALALVIAQRFDLPGLRQSIGQNLDASGNPQGYSTDEYIALTLVFSIIAAMVTGIVTWVILGHVGYLWVGGVGLLSFYAALRSLHVSAQARLRRISKKLPYTLDLVALMMASGSTFAEAIITIVHDEPEDDLNQELQIVQAEIDLGTRRSVALTHMADRIALETLRSVVGAINQAEALGTPLSTILSVQAGMMRMHRSIRAEKLAASAGLQILLPTMLVVFASMLALFGPFVIKWFAGGFDLGR